MDWKEILKTTYHRLFYVHEPRNNKIFSLGERPMYQAGGELADQTNAMVELDGDEGRAQDLNLGIESGQSTLMDSTDSNEDQLAKIVLASEGLTHHIDAILEKRTHPDQVVSDLCNDLKDNLMRIKRAFRMGTNADVIIREFLIPLKKPVKAAAVYMEGLIDKKVINDNILAPLMLLTELKESPVSNKPLTIVLRELLPSNQVEEILEFTKLIAEILSGNTVVLLDGENVALTTETKGFEHRGVERPQNEAVVIGPHQAFNESLRTNTALVRRLLRTPDLITEMLEVGTLSRVNIAIMYLHGIVNPKLVAEVKRRLKAIKTDYLASASVEQYIQDNTISIAPQVLHTERPDRVAGFLNEGHVVIMVDGAPFGLIVPVTFWSLIHTSEDYHLRWPIGTFLRMVRVLAVGSALLVPGLYVAIVNFHQEMIPTELLLAIAGSREKVPFPVVIEVLLMVISFELIREASVRVPNVIGPTIGIVGAIVVGQAAVAANVVSPILVVIIAITALGSFGIPSFQLSMGVRIFQFVYLLAGATVGFYGIAAVLMVMILHFAGLQNFGVPFTSPVAPYRGPIHDVVIRAPTYDMTNRPAYTRPQKRQREKIVTRTWDPKAPKSPKKGDEQNDS